MNTTPHSLRRYLSLPLIALLGMVEASPAVVATVTASALMIASAPQAQALPVHRVARRTSRRTTRRVVRRHLFVMPAAAAAVTFGPYRYYRYGGVYYYPYMIQGRTTYIEIDIDASGNPMAPPPASQVEVEIDIH